MAKTKADTKNQKKGPKAKPKIEVKKATRKRKTDSNPFDEPPDAGQASIMKFAQVQSQSSAVSSVPPPSDTPVAPLVHKTEHGDKAGNGDEVAMPDVTHDVTPTSVQQADEHMVPDVVHDVTPTSVQQADEHMVPDVTHDVTPTSVQQADEHMVPDVTHDVTPTSVQQADEHMELELGAKSTIVPEAFQNTNRGPHINLSEIVVTTREKTTGPMSVWRPLLGVFLQCLSDDEMNLLVTQCKAHPRLDDHVRHTMAINGIQEDEWTFADPEGDVPEDVEEMITWLVAEDQSGSMPAVGATPMDSATTADTSSPQA